MTIRSPREAQIAFCDVEKIFVPSEYIVFPTNFAAEFSMHINALYSLDTIQSKLYDRAYAVEAIHAVEANYTTKAARWSLHPSGYTSPIRFFIGSTSLCSQN